MVALIALLVHSGWGHFSRVGAASSSSSGGEKTAKDFVFVSGAGDFGADTEPVVFLLGWAGCREALESELIWSQ